MVLIEAEEKGGSISAGRTCLAMKRPLFVPVYEGMPKSAIGNRILLKKGARELKKNKQTNRANLTQIEEILFGEKENDIIYPIDEKSYEAQLSLFESSVSYSKTEGKKVNQEESAQKREKGR